MFENLVEVDLTVNNIKDCQRGMPMLALIYGEYHTGELTTNCRYRLVFESGRCHYNAYCIERLWKIKGYIPTNIQKLIIENIYDKEPLEYGKCNFDDHECWYFMTDINTHTLYLIIPNYILKRFTNAEDTDFSKFRWNQLPALEHNNYYNLNCSYTFIVLPSDINESNYSIKCHEIIKKLSKQCRDYFRNKTSRVIFDINSRNCGYADVEIRNYCGEWYGELSIYLPIGNDNFVQPYLFNKYIVDSYVTATWGNIYDKVRYREFKFCSDSKQEVIHEINELMSQITTELNSVSADEICYVLNGSGYYKILTNYPDQKPGFYKIELFIPTDETSLIRKDVMDSEKIILGERLCGDWGWITSDQKFRYRSLELPTGNDYKKEIQTLI